MLSVKQINYVSGSHFVSSDCFKKENKKDFFAKENREKKLCVDNIK